MILLFTALLLPAAARAQSGHTMRAADSAAAALNPALALQLYEQVIRADSSNADAYSRASMNAVDLGEFEQDQKKREEFYRKGELLARRAVALKPEDAEPHFHLARALGVVALSVGVRQRIAYAREIRQHALASLKLAPDHAGALHVMGVWNAEVMRLSFAERLLARAFLGAGFFSEASWEDARRYMERSAQVDPERLTHHLDLARIYRDLKLRDLARASYKRVIDGRAVHFNDTHYKRLAAAELARLRQAVPAPDQ
jgi:tetratricopeptide (TPR) repeat protein